MSAPPTVPVGALLDAELAVLGPPGCVPVMPAWAALTAEGREAARQDAHRSLVAGQLRDPDMAGPDGLRRDVRSVLVLRANAPVAAAVARSSPTGRDHWYAHLTCDVVLLEQVSLDGVHRFALAEARALPRLLVAAVLHPATPPADGRAPDTVQADEAEWVRADLSLRSREGSVCLSLVSGPGGAWSLGEGGADRISRAAAGRMLRRAVDRLLRVVAAGHGE